MVPHVVTPVDGSPESWRGAETAIALARTVDASVTVLSIADSDGERAERLDQIARDLSLLDTSGVEVEVDVRTTGASIAAAIEEVVELFPGAAVVMASHGRGRSSALVGSVAEDVLRRTFGPLLVVGPNVRGVDFSGPVIVTVDGSAESERAVPLAVALSIELGVAPWIMEVASQRSTPPPGGVESVYVARLAHEAQRASGHEVEFEEVHGQQPAVAIADEALRRSASMIVSCSHGRTGLRRLALGSVSAGFVRHAPCPVLLVREPHPAEPVHAAHGHGETH
ncbi:MAG: universal stress protein [Actinomycetota bacterium]